MRGRWEGNITQLPNGRYRAQISINGARLSHTADTRREVRRWLTDLRQQADNGVHPERLTVADALNRYLEHLRMSGSATTVERASTVSRTYQAEIGTIPLHRLTAQRLNKIFASRLELGYAPGTIACERRYLRAAIQRLVNDGTLARNPVRGTTTPRVAQRDYSHVDELAHAAVAALRREPQWIAYALLLATGMRLGELLGLQWGDIQDTPGGCAIRIERTDRISLKTPNSRRTVTIGQPLAGQLSSRRGYPEQRVIQYSRTRLGQVWRKHAPRGLRLHDLRHAHASELLAAGVPITAVSRRLGHASTVITLGIYAHMVDTIDARVADAVDTICQRMA